MRPRRRSPKEHLPEFSDTSSLEEPNRLPRSPADAYCDPSSHPPSGICRAHELDDEIALAWPIVEVDENNLLPGAEKQLAVRERNHERRSEQRSTAVRMSVAVMPGVLVMVPRVPGRDALEHRGQVAHEARLVLDRRQRRSRARHKHQRLSFD